MAEAPKQPPVRINRSELKTVVAFVPPKTSKDLKQIALNEDVTVQIVLERAIFDLIDRYNAKDKKTLAALREAAGTRAPKGPIPASEKAYKPA